MSTVRQRKLYKRSRQQKTKLQMQRRGMRRPALNKAIGFSRHFFKQVYRPSTTALTINSGSGGSYESSEGLLLGPVNTANNDMHGSLYFQLADLPQQGTFGSLFDCYKINKVVVSFEPIQNSIGAGGSLGTATDKLSQSLITVIDKDDASTSDTQDDLEQYESYKKTPAYQKHKRVLVPAISQQAFKTSTTTIAYTQKTKQWVDIAYTDVPHYGIKFCIPSYSTASTNYRCGWIVRVKAYLAFKQVR